MGHLLDPTGPMATNKSPGDSTNADENVNFKTAEVQQAELDPSNVATTAMSLKAILAVLRGVDADGNPADPAQTRGEQATVAAESITTTDTYQWEEVAKGGDVLSLTGHYEIQNTGSNGVTTQVLYSRVPASSRDAPDPSSDAWHELAAEADTSSGAARDASFDESVTAIAIGYKAAVGGSQTTVSVYGGLQ